MSSIRDVNRDQSACPHCGADTFVGSWRIRDLYASPADDDAWSEVHGLIVSNADDVEEWSPFGFISLEISDISKADLIRASTAVDKSKTRFCTRSGSSRRLCAV